MTNARWNRRMSTLVICTLAYCWVLFEVSSGVWWKFAALLWGGALLIAAVGIPAEVWYYKHKAKKRLARYHQRMDTPKFGGDLNEDDWREDR